MKKPWVIWSGLAVLLVILYYWYGQVTDEFYRNGARRAGIGVAAGVMGIVMALRFPNLTGRKAALVILFTAFILRICVLPTAPSDDVNRYLWEGNLYSQGISPYTESADHAIYIPHRDGYWENMNHKDKITAYPPLALHFFGVINRFSYTPTAYKVTFLIADLVLITLLLLILAHYKRPLHWALFYALSPISILAFAAEGHFDIIMVLFLVFATLAYAKKWFVLCGVAMGLAVATKIMVVIAAPMILLKTGKKGMIAAALACGIPFLLHFDDTLQMVHGLVNFGSKNNFNGFFNQFVDDIIGTSPQLASHICLGGFLISWCIAFWLSVKGKLWVSLSFCLGGLILFAPIVHFWYFTWFLPFVALRPSASWVSFSISAPLYFLVHPAFMETGNWELPVWARWFFWLPFLVITLVQLPQQLPAIYGMLKGSKSPKEAS